MKRLLVLCAGLASLLALASVQADVPIGASTSGVNHTFITREQHSSFTVKDYGPDAGPEEVDSGVISYQDFTNDVHYNADIVCARVFNINQANFAFQIPQGPDAGRYQVYSVVDGGEPGTNGDQLGITLTADEETACLIVNSFAVSPNQTITAGDIQVR
jgi:hypothetical protein